MNARRCYVSVAVLGETVYAMGGYDGHHRQNTAERFNHRTNQWSLVAPMNAQRSDASAAALDSKEMTKLLTTISEEVATCVIIP